MKLIVSIVVIVLLLLGAVFRYPPDDRAHYDQCVQSHMEMIPMTSLDANGNVTTSMMYIDHCDAYQPHDCLQWEDKTTFLGGKYKACSLYN